MGFYVLWAICSIQATIHSSFSYPLLLGYPIGLLMPRLESRPLRIRNGRRLQRSIELYGLISLYGWEGRLCSSEARPLLRILVCSTILAGFYGLNRQSKSQIYSQYSIAILSFILQT